MARKKKFHDPTQQTEGKASRWVNEPLQERHPSLIVHTNRPFNAEPSNSALQHMYTPKGCHYRRTHAPVPLIDESTYLLSVEIEQENDTNCLRQFSLAELRKKRQKEICVTMMCTGNRRGEFNKYGFTAGLPWANGSISTAKWGGCLVADVLNDAGVFYAEMVANGYNFLTFIGLGGYRVSIPLHKGMDRGSNGDCMLASVMNNEALPRDHGAPLRVITPGYVGARSVKWLDKIIVMKKAVESLHQTGIAYKQLGPNYKKLSPKLGKMVREAPPIDVIPVTSAITAPDNESVVEVVGRGHGESERQEMDIRGYAYSGGGRAIIRVDVSIDDGKTWNQAELTRATKQHIRSNRAWAWCQWRHGIKVPHGTSELNICCKAIDDQYNQQPHHAEPIWNVRGILNTSWGRSNVKTIRSRL